MTSPDVRVTRTANSVRYSLVDRRQKVPLCRNGQPCPLPEPVRAVRELVFVDGKLVPQTTGCEGCQRQFILADNWDDPDTSFWYPMEDHLRDLASRGEPVGSFTVSLPAKSFTAAEYAAWRKGKTA